ncbi:hypothetical protein H0I23_07835 [Cellulophaga sp. HaHaR_3_176]|uniref:hypothetical protein n=1 Tax=Cellulophaga sp. HaHaR_3_176 TaxID=1942464 RepID=UPI001C1FA554|nr:hypothetical protein [Cellulophaga sp. HaHaR_3_176]QWX85538.1 hypothetical protein H0I23_07835 [Cellulophaga sp. HaHaR_3_176]
MSPLLRNIMAVLVGLLIGSVVNMGIIMVSSSIIPPPNGVNTTTMEGLKEAMHLFQPKHYIMPFLAHAIGTFAAAFISVKIAVTHKLKIAFSIGILFLIGGITNVFLLPSPIWFAITDVVIAYIPMAWIGSKIGTKK